MGHSGSAGDQSRKVGVSHEAEETHTPGYSELSRSSQEPSASSSVRSGEH